MNEDIRVDNVRLVSADGEQVGIKPISEALRFAQEAGLDLVEVANQADPPVCRVMDYGKYLFEKSKAAKEQKKNQNSLRVVRWGGNPLSIYFRPLEYQHRTKAMQSCIRKYFINWRNNE